MQKLPFFSVACVLSLLIPASRVLAQPAVTQDLVDQSTVIFTGHVEKTEASNLKILAASPQTVLVRVDEVLSAAKTMMDLKGATVTVFLKEPGAFKVGDNATFFTTGWLYGENVALKEVGHTAAGSSSEVASKQITDLRSHADDQKIQARIQHATLVVAGKVLSTRPFEGDKIRSNSEHDPEWWTADIAVQTYIKGRPAQGPAQVTLLYAHSRDVMWVRSPKLEKGEQGIFIATHYEPNGFFAEIRTPILAVLSPLDFHPMTERQRITRLTRASQ